MKQDLISKSKLLNRIGTDCHYDTEHPLEAYSRVISTINSFPTQEIIDGPTTTERPYYITKYGTAFEKICAELEHCCSLCTKPCETTRCLAYRIDTILCDREAQVRNLNIDELFEKKDESQFSLFDP